MAVTIARNDEKPLEIIDQYRIKVKFAEDNCVPEDGTPFQIKLHSRNMLDELARYSSMGVKLPEDGNKRRENKPNSRTIVNFFILAQVFITYETSSPDVIDENSKDFAGIVPHKHDESVLDTMPSKAFGRLGKSSLLFSGANATSDTPYAYVAMKAWSKNILQKKLEISKVSSATSNSIFDCTYA